MPKRSVILLVFGIISALAVISCSKKDSAGKDQNTSAKSTFDRGRADLEYRQLQTEIHLAETKQLYFVINLRRKLLAFKLKGATVWSEPIVQVEPDSSAFNDFARSFETKDGQLMRHIAGKYLFAADKKTPDSILAIVGEAMNVKPELLQREVPARFQLTWADGLSLDIRTDIIAKYKMEPLKKAIKQVKQVFSRPFGETNLVIRMTPEAALTLYRASTIGLPTIIYPPL